MWEPNKLGLQYLSPTRTRSPIRIGIALRCDLSSPSYGRYLTLCRNTSLSRNPSRSRSPSSTRSHTGIRST